LSEDKPLRKSVILFDGPIGVGKTSLGSDVASQLDFGFIDGDDHAGQGHWLRSILSTSRKIVSATEVALQSHKGAIVSYPMRCTNWLFYKATFQRLGINVYSIGLIADLESIINRERDLTTDELARSREMINQGYGQREFHDLIFWTNQASLEATGQNLTARLSKLLDG